MKEALKIQLKANLKELRLPVFIREFESCARQAKSEGDVYEEYLLNLSEKEIQQRHANQLQRRLREAKFPQLKTLENSDINLWPKLKASDLRSYCEGEFIEKKENIVLIGKHGTGKTHAAIALGIEACRKGHRTWFTTAAHLVNSLIEAKDEKHLKRQLSRLNKIELLIIDELGYIPFSKEGARLLFQVFSDRYEHGSLLVTSNLPFAQWTEIFDDDNLTAALLDRLTHHCDIHHFDWNSIRLTESIKRQKKTDL